MPESSVIYRKDGNVAFVTMNRPGADNVIDRQLAQGMEEACARINQDNEVYIAVITGAGNKAFCTGSGVKADVAAMVAGIDRPVIAAVNGDALGEGLEIALACDIRLASEKAGFGLPQLAEGKIPAGGGTQRLPRLIGRGKAMEMIFTAEIISAAEALEIGLVSKVLPPEQLAAEAEALAKKMATQAPISLRYVKEAVNKGMDMTLEQGLRLEADLYMILQTTSDRTEGITAFLQKRKPEFRGE
jgi:enoyl-CoA hydratase/carnithine racemase